MSSKTWICSNFSIFGDAKINYRKEESETNNFKFKICAFCFGLTLLVFGVDFAKPQSIPIPELNFTLKLDKDEEILTEISTKFNRQQVEELLTKAGFAMTEWYTDTSDLHGLALAKKP